MSSIATQSEHCTCENNLASKTLIGKNKYEKEEKKQKRLDFESGLKRTLASLTVMS